MRKVSLLLFWGILMTGVALTQSSLKTAVQKPKVFAAIYQRGSAYQKEKNIFQQPSIKEHIAHHEALGKKLIAAGPLKALPEDKIVGIIVFEAESEEVAQQWLRKDPAVVNKVFDATVRQWGVSSIREFHLK